MRISRVLRICMVVAVVLAGCGGEPASESASSTKAADSLPARAQTGSSPTGPDLNPLEKTLLSRLRAIDPNALRTDHGFKDAHARARIAGDQVYIDIPTPNVSREKVRRTVWYSGIQMQAVSRQTVGHVWRFGCRLNSFGDREVYVWDVPNPRRVVPAVFRLLRCRHAPLDERIK